MTSLPNIKLGLNDYFTCNGVVAMDSQTYIICGNLGMHYFNDKGFKSHKFR
jgi:hypothetical protein